MPGNLLSLFPSYLFVAFIELITVAGNSHGSRTEAKERASSLPAAKQFLLPLIMHDNARHFRPGRGLQSIGGAPGLGDVKPGRLWSALSVGGTCRCPFFLEVCSLGASLPPRSLYLLSKISELRAKVLCCQGRS